MLVLRASLGAQMVKICLQCRRPSFDPWVGKIPWRREWLPTPLRLPGEFHRQRSLVGLNPWCRRVRHDWATNTFMSLFTFSAHKNSADICILVLYLVTLLIYLSLLVLLFFFVYLLGFSCIESCHLWIKTALIFPFQFICFYFSFLSTMTKTSNEVLNRRHESGHYFILSLRGKSFTITINHKCDATCRLFIDALYHIEEVSFFTNGFFLLLLFVLAFSSWMGIESCQLLFLHLLSSSFFSYFKNLLNSKKNASSWLPTCIKMILAGPVDLLPQSSTSEMHTSYNQPWWQLIGLVYKGNSDPEMERAGCHGQRIG